MGKRKGGKSRSSAFDHARDELFSQIQHCGVLKATAPQKDHWFKDTMNYMATRYSAVSQDELEDLEALGRRYCEPVIRRGDQNEVEPLTAE